MLKSITSFNISKPCRKENYTALPHTTSSQYVITHLCPKSQYGH